MVSEESVAEYSFTGMDTSPKLSDSDAMERAAMVFPCRCGAIRPLELRTCHVQATSERGARRIRHSKSGTWREIAAAARIILPTSHGGIP